MEYCDTCKQEMKRTVWKDEAWGRMYSNVEYSCVNPKCGIEFECDYCGESTEDPIEHEEELPFGRYTVRLCQGCNEDYLKEILDAG